MDPTMCELSEHNISLKNEVKLLKDEKKNHMSQTMDFANQVINASKAINAAVGCVQKLTDPNWFDQLNASMTEEDRKNIISICKTAESNFPVE